MAGMASGARSSRRRPPCATPPPRRTWVPGQYRYIMCAPGRSPSRARVPVLEHPLHQLAAEGHGELDVLEEDLRIELVLDLIAMQPLPRVSKVEPIPGELAEPRGLLVGCQNDGLAGSNWRVSMYSSNGSAQRMRARVTAGTDTRGPAQLAGEVTPAVEGDVWVWSQSHLPEALGASLDSHRTVARCLYSLPARPGICPISA